MAKSFPAYAGQSLMTVRAALKLPQLRLGSPEVVAGRIALDLPVRWAHSGEISNMATFLKGGELVLTTGMGIGKRAPDQRRFVADLAERGIAGLALELGTTFGRPPAPLVQEAESRSLPLVALHREVSFVEITEAIHREIVNRQFALMRRGDQMHRRFTELMLEGAGIPEVLSVLAQTIANPVVLERAGRGILYHATHHAGDSDVLAGWKMLSCGLADAPESVLLPVPMAGGETWGSLAAMAIDSPLDEFDYVAVERAVALIALALLRSRQEEVLNVRERGNFLYNLLETELDDTEAANQASAMGFSRTTEFLLPFAVGGSFRSNDSSGRDDAAWGLVWRDIRAELESSGTPVIAGTRAGEDDMLIVVGLVHEGRRREMADRVSTVLRRAWERHFGGPSTAVIAVGSAVRNWSGLRPALREAVDALAAAPGTSQRSWHDATRPELDRLLWSLRDTAELRAFVRQRLSSIIEHDRGRKAKLLPTLEAYCAHGGRKTETARALHVERQSLYHRIDRIEELLQEDLSAEETLLSVHLALRARRHFADEHADADAGARRHNL
jgi:purine catabolism regulator